MKLLEDGHVLRTIVALFAVMGVLTLPPVFLSATAGMDKAEKRRIAIQTTCAVAITMFVSFFVGTHVLKLFKIDMDAFKIAGAVVVANMAWGMIVGRASALLDTGGRSPAVIPLAIPKTAGPGAIATVIAMGEEISTAALVSNVLAIAIVTVLALVFMLGAGLFERTLGDSGLNIVARVFGLLLLAIAITSVALSLKDLYPGWSAT